MFSVAFSSPANSPLPLVLVALMSLVFLSIEARRYRYFDIWRTRVRIMETGMFAPILRGEGVRIESGWNLELARDYENLRFHISFFEAAGRRLRFAGRAPTFFRSQRHAHKGEKP